MDHVVSALMLNLLDACSSCAQSLRQFGDVLLLVCELTAFGHDLYFSINALVQRCLSQYV
jgi:hypothetical protein